MEYQEWERNFRDAAKADGYAIFRDHLRRLKLPDSPELLLEGTILAVRATCGYRLLDNSDGKYVDQLLEMQHYNPADSTNAHYAYTFDIYGDTYARVLVESGSKAIDLADLFNHPWEEYKVAGFSYLYISRTDWSELTSEEVQQLEDDVTADLRYDYGEEEVGFWFDQPDGNTSLMMHIYDEPGEEEKYELLKGEMNSASGLGISFLDFLYLGEYRLPDMAKYRPCPDVASQTDFYYVGNGVSGACLFVDDSDHVDPTRKERDMAARTALEDCGYRVIVIRLDWPLEEQVSQYADIFGEGEKRGRDPSDADAFITRGNEYEAMGDRERAIQDYSEAIRLDPENAKAYYYRALAYGYLKEYERTIEDLDEAIALSPRNAGAYSNRGIAYAALSQPERAIEDYEQAISLNPLLATAYINRGNLYATLGQPERAIEDYDETIRLDPLDAQAHINRGGEYRKLGRLEQAMQDLDEALKLDPENAMGYGSRGAVYQELGWHDRAIQDLNETIRINPEDTVAYNNRGIAYYELDQMERATQDYDEAIRLDPGYSRTYFNRGIAYYDLGKYRRAIRDYADCIRLAPNDAAACSARGSAHHAVGHYRKAIKDYDAATLIDPQYAPPYVGRTIAYTCLNMDKKAREEFDRAVDLGCDRAHLEEALSKI